MPKLTRIYTRTGDDGMTGLVGGGRIKKSAARIDAYGTLDELSSAIGVARAALRPLVESECRAARLDAWLAWTQDALFDLGSELATLPMDRGAGAMSASDGDVAALEGAIDAAQRELPALAEFIHPGGSLPGAHLHVARTVCRRAERLAVALADTGDEGAAHAVRFLNRLSDALFVWARWINHALGIPEHVWNKSRTPPD
jgi:cob(I)alamin adenosyltransferase